MMIEKRKSQNKSCKNFIKTSSWLWRKNSQYALYYYYKTFTLLPISGFVLFFREINFTKIFMKLISRKNSYIYLLLRWYCRYKWSNMAPYSSWILCISLICSATFSMPARASVKWFCSSLGLGAEKINK